MVALNIEIFGCSVDFFCTPLFHSCHKYVTVALVVDVTIYHWFRSHGPSLLRPVVFHREDTSPCYGSFLALAAAAAAPRPSSTWSTLRSSSPQRLLRLLTAPVCVVCRGAQCAACGSHPDEALEDDMGSCCCHNESPCASVEERSVLLKADAKTTNWTGKAAVVGACGPQDGDDVLRWGVGGFNLTPWTSGTHLAAYIFFLLWIFFHRNQHTCPLSIMLIKKIILLKWFVCFAK